MTTTKHIWKLPPERPEPPPPLPTMTPEQEQAAMTALTRTAVRFARTHRNLLADVPANWQANKLGLSEIQLRAIADRAGIVVHAAAIIQQNNLTVLDVARSDADELLDAVRLDGRKVEIDFATEARRRILDALDRRRRAIATIERISGMRGWEWLGQNVANIEKDLI